jgi:hypothetical protein
MQAERHRQIGASILAIVENRWRKVAFIIASVLRDLGDRVAAEDVAQRIQALVAKGQLERQGDLILWRRSEVRRRTMSPGKQPSGI